MDAIQVSLGRSAIGQADSLNLVVRKDQDLSLSSVRRWRIDIGTLDNYDINIILMILMKIKGFLTWPLTTLLFSSTSFQYRDSGIMDCLSIVILQQYLLCLLESFLENFDNEIDCGQYI